MIQKRSDMLLNLLSFDTENFSMSSFSTAAAAAAVAAAWR
jgi:hypothetical protein